MGGPQVVKDDLTSTWSSLRQAILRGPIEDRDQCLVWLRELWDALRDLRTRNAGLLRKQEQLRWAGTKLANLAYNWAQAEGKALDASDCRMLDLLRREWDAVPVAGMSRTKQTARGTTP